MDQTQITNLLNILKTTTDKNVMLRGLHRIRGETVTNNEGISAFRESKGIPVMVKLLGKPKEEILEIALSILANCCSDKTCCEEAFESRVVVNLVAILKSIPNPVIQCRACRLLGNLAKTNAEILLQHGSQTIAKSLCQIVEETSDVSTRVMAIRAARYLVADPKFLKYFLQSNGFCIMLQLLTSIMRKPSTTIQEDETKIDRSKETQGGNGGGGLKKNQHREKYFEEVARSLECVRSDIFDREILKHSDDRPDLYEIPTEKPALDLSFEIIKCLSTMSDLEIALPIWNGLNQRGYNLSTIAFFASEHSKCRSIALRILANFAKNPEACYVLSNSSAVTAACDLLLTVEMEKPLTESETRYCLNILGQLSVDSCNRSKIRRSGAIRKLIMMLRESKSEVEISYILQLLNNFQYDNLSMELMLQEGLTTVLIRELSNYIESDNEYHRKRREERQERSNKRKLKCESIERPKCKIGRLSDDYVPPEFESPSCSPQSSFSPNSPCSSRSISPLFRTEGNEDELTNEEETYSPVCSDDDDEDNSENEGKEGQESEQCFMKLLEGITTTRSADNTDDEKDGDETSQDVPPLKPLGNMPRSIIDIIENLIFRITLLVNKRPELGKCETLSTLTKAISTFGSNNNFVGALTNILQESQFFAQTVKHGIVHKIYQLTKKPETSAEGFNFLDTLTSVGESNYGKAELVRLLRSEDNFSQKRAAIAVAYIVKNSKLLIQFLCDGNALNIILDIILNGHIEEEDELTSEAADALTSLSLHTLSINVPFGNNFVENRDITVSNEMEEKSICDSLKDLSLDSDMRFILKETEASEPVVVEFNKQLLCDSSEVFETMFNSSFREGCDNEVRLQNYTRTGLEYFLNLVMSIKRANPVFHLPPQEKYHALLEAYEMSRIYNLSTMEKMGRSMLIQLLDEQNCLQVLEWSMKNNHPELMEYAINYYLCSMLPTKTKIKLFRSTNSSKCATEWLEMLTDAILCRCHNGF